jgi:hypothetical protein
MQIAGAFMVMTLFFGGFMLAEAIFLHQTGRMFWRAMVPTALRFMILPEDRIEMDSFKVMEEWSALMFFGAYLMLPLMALSVMTFIYLF